MTTARPRRASRAAPMGLATVQALADTTAPIKFVRRLAARAPTTHRHVRVMARARAKRRPPCLAATPRAATPAARTRAKTTRTVRAEATAIRRFVVIKSPTGKGAPSRTSAARVFASMAFVAKASAKAPAQPARKRRPVNPPGAASEFLLAKIRTTSALWTQGMHAVWTARARAAAPADWAHSEPRAVPRRAAAPP